jgi:hypothetical protein
VGPRARLDGFGEQTNLLPLMAFEHRIVHPVFNHYHEKVGTSCLRKQVNGVRNTFLDANKVDMPVGYYHIATLPVEVGIKIVSSCVNTNQ